MGAVRTPAEAAARLATLDPAHQAVIEGDALTNTLNGDGVQVRITSYEGDRYRAQVDAPHPAILRIATPYYPGWRAEIDGTSAQLLPIDLALIGVRVPSGSHELTLSYHPTWFTTGLVVSLAAWLTAVAGLVRQPPN